MRQPGGIEVGEQPGRGHANPIESRTALGHNLLVGKLAQFVSLIHVDLHLPPGSSSPLTGANRPSSLDTTPKEPLPRTACLLSVHPRRAGGQQAVQRGRAARYLT